MSTPAPVRFGFVGVGRIAVKVARDLRLVDGAALSAVGSRDLERAQQFAASQRDDHGGVRAHGSYADLLADPEVDVVYVATPHSSHLELALAAFDAGKHVLCEKPVTLDHRTALAMVEAARAQGLFLMEAMWTACHPVVRRIADDLRTGRFGTPHHVRAELGFRVDDPPSSRMLDPVLGASAVLDMGVYPLTFARLMLGEPERLSAVGVLSDGGIDLDVAIAGRYRDGAVASLGVSMTSWSSESASIATDAGRIEVPRPFHHPSHAIFTPCGPDGEPQRIDSPVPLEGRGYEFELAEVVRCVRDGFLESPLVPHEQTLAMMASLDDVREQLGVRFPTS